MGFCLNIPNIDWFEILLNTSYFDFDWEMRQVKLINEKDSESI